MILNNLNKQTNTPDLLASLSFRMYLAYITDVDIKNFPKAENATISSNILLPGAVFKYFDALTNSINPNVAPGEVPLNGSITLTPQIEGLSKETLSWVYKNNGKYFVVVFERCSDGQLFIAGDKCSGGLQFKYTSIWALENGTAGIATSFTGGECPEPLWFYDGPLLLEAPEAVTPDAVTFALTAKSQYQLGVNTKATVLTDITGVTDASVGRVFEVLGSGSDFATKFTSSNSIILKNGLDFVASAGSRINFLIIKTGTSSYAFQEVFRA